MAICVGWVRGESGFRFFSGKYGPDGEPRYVNTVAGAARFESNQDPELVRFEQYMRTRNLEIDYRDVPDQSSVIDLHPDVMASLSKLLHADAVTIFVNQQGHGLSPDPRVYLYPWKGDAGSYALAHETHREARENPQFVLELPGWHGRKLLSPRDAENLKSLLDEHGVPHGSPMDESD